MLSLDHGSSKLGGGKNKNATGGVEGYLGRIVSNPISEIEVQLMLRPTRGINALCYITRAHAEGLFDTGSAVGYLTILV